MRADRILVIGPFAPGQLPISFARAFERLGHQVLRYDSDAAYFAAAPGAEFRVIRRMLRPLLWRRVNRETVEVVRDTRPDLVLAVKGTYLHPSTIRFIRCTLGIPICNYYPDNPFCGVPWHPRRTSAQRRDLLSALREYTRVWIWERGLVSRLADTGVAAAYLPFGVDPEMSAAPPRGRCDDCSEEHPVVFIGRHTDKRQAHVAGVRRHRVAVWGTRWRRAQPEIGSRHRIHHRQLAAQACASVYSAASVCLNVVDDLNMPGHNMRTFEIPASGALMLSTYTDEQAEFFPDGEAALYYRDAAELDDKLDRALKDRAWAARARRRAAAIAAGHTYTERVKTMLREGWR
jgi:spore maturation protein CgeB